MWLHNQPVTVLSSNCQPEVTVVQRKQKDGTRVEIDCPTAIVSYSKFMAGVDQGEQLRQYYHVRSKSRKMYKYIFWFMFDMSITNSFILYRHFLPHVNKPHNVKTFRLELAKQLIGDYNSRKIRGRPSHLHGTDSKRISLRHFPIKNKTESKKGLSRCWYCRNRRDPPKRKETCWYCFQCEKYLCHTGELNSDCFLDYHKEEGMIS